MRIIAFVGSPVEDNEKEVSCPLMWFNVICGGILLNEYLIVFNSGKQDHHDDQEGDVVV